MIHIIWLESCESISVPDMEELITWLRNKFGSALAEHDLKGLIFCEAKDGVYSPKDIIKKIKEASDE